MNLTFVEKPEQIENLTLYQRRREQKLVRSTF